jgi:hypothetical protein
MPFLSDATLRENVGSVLIFYTNKKVGMKALRQAGISWQTCRHSLTPFGCPWRQMLLPKPVPPNRITEHGYRARIH